VDGEYGVNTAGLAYLEWFYNNDVWKDLQYRGVRTLKLPLDMWNYQELIFANNVHWVIETGTRHGGSALFFADLLVADEREGFVVTIDISHDGLDAAVAGHPGIRFLLGDSAADAVVKQAMALVPPTREGGLLLMLDSDHAAPHVLRELNAWVPLLRRGDYLVVEDTIVNGHPVRPDFGPGPMEAIVEYVAANPGRLVADDARESKFGCTVAAHGYYKVA
jgi:cephalosporin hydroxylase